MKRWRYYTSDGIVEVTEDAINGHYDGTGNTTVFELKDDTVIVINLDRVSYMTVEDERGKDD